MLKFGVLSPGKKSTGQLNSPAEKELPFKWPLNRAYFKDNGDLRTSGRRGAALGIKCEKKAFNTKIILDAEILGA
jgi:hypothetical protein